MSIDKVKVDFMGNAWIDGKDLFANKEELKKVLEKVRNCKKLKNITYIRKNK